MEKGTIVKVVAEVGYKGFEGVVVGEAFTSRTDGKKCLIVEVEKVGRKYLEVEEVEAVNEKQEVITKKVVKSKIKAVKDIVAVNRIPYTNKEGKELTYLYAIGEEAIEETLEELEKIAGLVATLERYDYIEGRLGQITVRHDGSRGRSNTILDIYILKEDKEEAKEEEPTVEEEEVEEYLLNMDTKVISKEGDVMGSPYYVTVLGREVKVDGGFKFVGKMKTSNREVEAFLSEEDYFEGKEFKEGTKAPSKKKDILTKVKEALGLEEAEVNLNTTLGKRLKAVQDLQLKKGDLVRIKFLDGEDVKVRVERVGYMSRQTVNNKMIERFYIEDQTSFAWDLYKAVSIQVLSRNPRSKRVLTENMKQFNGAVAYYLAQDKAREGYFQKKQEDKVKAEAIRKELAKGVEEAYYKKLKTNKEKVQQFAEKEGLVLGCWNSLLEDFTEASLKHVLGSIDVGSATDIVVRNNLQEYVVSVDFVDNEIDFTLWTKAEYISIFGADKFIGEY